MQRGNNRATCFLDNLDFGLFCECLASAIARYPCSLHAFVLMPNHFHLLLTPHAPGAIGKVMQSIGRRYVRCFNERHGRTGTLWEGRFRARLIDSARYLLACYRYIELNPVRAGLANDPAAYRWSSYRTNALGHDHDLIIPHPVYTALGSDATSRAAAYQALFASEIDETIRAAIRPSLTLV